MKLLNKFIAIFVLAICLCSCQKENYSPLNSTETGAQYQKANGKNIGSEGSLMGDEDGEVEKGDQNGGVIGGGDDDRDGGDIGKDNNGGGVIGGGDDDKDGGDKTGKGTGSAG